MLAVAASGGLLNAAISEATAKAFEPTVDSQTQQSAAMQFTAETAVIADHMLLQGVVESSNSATVSAQVSGRVERVLVDVGATVPAGATILTITSVEQYQMLTQAQLRSANAAVERAEEQLSYTEVKAPYGGVVSDRWVEPGELVQPGTPLLSGFDPAQLRIHVDLPADYAQPVQIQVGEHLGLQIPQQAIHHQGELTLVRMQNDSWRAAPLIYGTRTEIRTASI